MAPADSLARLRKVLMDRADRNEATPVPSSVRRPASAGLAHGREVELAAACVDWNHRRLHSACGDVPRAEFEVPHTGPSAGGCGSRLTKPPESPSAAAGGEIPPITDRAIRPY